MGKKTKKIGQIKLDETQKVQQLKKDIDQFLESMTEQTTAMDLINARLQWRQRFDAVKAEKEVKSTGKEWKDINKTIACHTSPKRGQSVAQYIAAWCREVESQLAQHYVPTGEVIAAEYQKVLDSTQSKNQEETGVVTSQSIASNGRTAQAMVRLFYKISDQLGLSLPQGPGEDENATVHTLLTYDCIGGALRGKFYLGGAGQSESEEAPFLLALISIVSHNMYVDEVQLREAVQSFHRAILPAHVGPKLTPDPITGSSGGINDDSVCAIRQQLERMLRDDTQHLPGTTANLVAGSEQSMGGVVINHHMAARLQQQAEANKAAFRIAFIPAAVVVVLANSIKQLYDGRSFSMPVLAAIILLLAGAAYKRSHLSKNDPFNRTGLFGLLSEGVQEDASATPTA